MMDHQQQFLIETIKKNSDMVYRLAFSQTKNKVDADDVYQEVFLRFVKKSLLLKMIITKKHGLSVLPLTAQKQILNRSGTQKLLSLMII